MLFKLSGVRSTSIFSNYRLMLATIGKMSMLPFYKPNSKRSFKVLESYKIENLEDWRKWRNTKGIPSASILASCYGLGYDTFTSCIRRLSGLCQKDTDSFFAKKAMTHGSEYESRAKEIFLEHLIEKETETTKNVIVNNGEISEVIEITYSERFIDETESHNKYQFLMTPDMIYSRDGKNTVVEFKCPAYGIAVGKNEGSVWVTSVNYVNRYKQGKPSHFIQAGCYALFSNAEIFYVVLLFTDGTNEEVVSFGYKMTEELKEYIYYGIFKCNCYIAVAKAGGLKYPVRTAKQINILRIAQIMEDSFISKSTLSVSVNDIEYDEIPDLDEENPDKSE